jgi:hypothetical protein
MEVKCGDSMDRARKWHPMVTMGFLTKQKEVGNGRVDNDRSHPTGCWNDGVTWTPWALNKGSQPKEC